MGWKMGILLAWWLAFLYLTGWSEGVQVTVPEQKKFAMLFQSVVLRCQFSTSSSQQPVVQWWYKSYCHDRTREAFSFTDSVTHQIPDQGSTSHLDCMDSSRTVRPVASRQGITFTLGESYKGRDITITNNADLRIGELQWGDSGVYYCKVVTSDDIMGQNEDRMELLVLEWVFVGVVILGAFTFILFLGICWCQCCPHSCCCYVQCPCCPESCCCPRHLYEAGKAVKTCASPHIAPVYPPYYVPNVPMAAIGPPAMMVPETQPPVMENSVAGVRSGYRIQANKEQDCMKVLYYVEKELAQFDPAKRTYEKSSTMSELSSLHEGDADFRQSCRRVQKKAVPPIGDQDDDPAFTSTAAAHVRKSARHPQRMNRSEEQYHSSRWNPRSEHLQRRMFPASGRTGSLDELEEFAESYHQKGRRFEYREPEPDYRLDCETKEHYPPPFRDQHHYRDDKPARIDRHQHQESFPDEYYSKRDRSREGFYESDRGHPYSPPSPKRRDLSDCYPPRYPTTNRAYDNTYLTSVLEKKARVRPPEESFSCETPCKSSSKKSSDIHYNRSASYRREEEDSLPPYSERDAERHRPLESLARPFSYTRDGTHEISMHAAHQRREREKLRKTNTLPSRDSLIV
ncbi:immunoglobulin-like domain-containing receptor 2 isoform X2 [Polyodon spathula]|uniref:immunoglobulin-like domain-containing receptor 2 isoform X2 n=1 Tax=Polyodon spathula TaxID=7913 RepID=UPI001B7D981C|nr:immunoglobulin-like domain-containing receptor 2 isoform X2 [Polyodon spathula]